MAPITKPPTTRAELDALNVIDPELVDAIQARPFPSPLPDSERGNIVAERAHRADHLKKLRHLYPIPGPIPEVVETTHSIPMRDGYEITIKVYTPRNPPKDGSPLVVMYHEGGWTMGDLTDEDLNCRMFARDLGCVCVNVDYRLAPESPWPGPVNDSWDALQWCAANASSLGADPSKGFLTGGASAGGNISAILSILARDNNLSPPLTGTYLSFPAVIFPTVLPSQYKELYISWQENIHDPVVRLDGVSDILQLYKPDFTSITVCPFLDPKNLQGLPRCYIQAAGLDPLRDDAVLYEMKLRSEGIPTKLEIYGGFGHMFWTNWPEMEASKNFIRDTLQGFKWLLEK